MTSIHFPVQAYDRSHLDLLTSGPRGVAIGKLLKSGLKTTDSAILIHAMFTEQDRARVGFRSYHELATRAASREAEFRDYIRLDGSAVHAVPGTQNNARKHQTERLGVACAVLVMNEILGITEADWEPIQESNKRKTLDYRRVASDGKSIVAVEAKGTIAERTHVKSSGSTSAMKADIEAKKRDARAEKRDGAQEEFGVITSIGESTDVKPTIFLLDPPAQGSERDPRRLRLLWRYHYYLRHVAIVSQFRMLTALRNRIEALSAVSRFEELDGITLRNADGEPFSLPEVFGDRPIVEVGEIVGRVLLSDRRQRKDRREPALFIGFARDIFDVLVAQTFDKVLAWRWMGAGESSGPVRVPTTGNADEDHMVLTGRVRVGINTAGIALGWFQPDRDRGE